jgi:hypothetical protein
MSYFDTLSDSLTSALERDAVGESVVFRLYLQVSGDHGLLAPVGAAGVQLAERCFGAESSVLHAQGSAASGYLSILAECRGRTVESVTSMIVLCQGKVIEAAAIPGRGRGPAVENGERGAGRQPSGV